MSNAAALEKHYRVSELGELWGFSHNTIIKLFATEPGVIRLESGMGRRKYTTLSIPESVALRIHERLSNNSLKPHLAAGNPLHVIRLRNLNGRVPKKPRNVLKLHATKQAPDSERIA